MDIAFLDIQIIRIKIYFIIDIIAILSCDVCVTPSHASGSLASSDASPSGGYRCASITCIDGILYFLILFIDVKILSRYVLGRVVYNVLFIRGGD